MNYVKIATLTLKMTAALDHNSYPLLPENANLTGNLQALIVEGHPATRLALSALLSLNYEVTELDPTGMSELYLTEHLRAEVGNGKVDLLILRAYTREAILEMIEALAPNLKRGGVKVVVSTPCEDTAQAVQRSFQGEVRSLPCSYNPDAFRRTLTEVAPFRQQ